jgi:hypothetical protein
LSKDLRDMVGSIPNDTIKKTWKNDKFRRKSGENQEKIRKMKMSANEDYYINISTKWNQIERFA